MGRIIDGFVTVEDKVHGALVRHSIKALRVTVGAVFLGFGVLKFPTCHGIKPERQQVDRLDRQALFSSACRRRSIRYLLSKLQPLLLAVSPRFAPEQGDLRERRAAASERCCRRVART